MTVDGVVKGGDRQQVSVSRTDDKGGSTANATTSQVLGDLTAQGIRTGASDSFSPETIQTGQAAVAALLNSGLLSVKNQPNVQAALNAPMPNGSAVTYTDVNGRVSLTLAGQAKVQAVYSQLKLTETFDVKHFADQGVAQVVTLVAAIVLTVMTAGAGVASIGAVMAGSAGTASAMINAALIAMASTMTGQLAGGATFDQAFQAGIKAGAISAVSAGVANGVDQYVHGANSTAPSTVASGTQTVQSGTNAATSGLSNLDRLGTGAYWQQTALNATAQGALSKLEGGSFKDGFVGSAVGSLAASGAGIIGDSTTGMPAANIAAHAVLGCAVAAAGSKDCAAGAIGGAASATIAPLIDGMVADSSLSKTTQNAIIAGGSVLGATVVAGVAGKDALTAGNAAGNEVLNNFLAHDEAAKREAAKQRLFTCKGDACVQAAADVKYWNELDAWRDTQIENACRIPASPACQGWNAAIQYAKVSYVGVDDRSIDRTGSMDAERRQVNTEATKYQQAVNNPYLFGVGKGLLKLTPPGLIAGVGVGAYELTTAILNNGLTDTAIAIAKGVANLPETLKAALNNSDPSVRGEALVDALALGSVATAVTGKLVQSGVIVVKAGVNGIENVSVAADGANKALTPYGTTLSDEMAALQRISTSNTSTDGSIFNSRISLRQYVVNGDVNGLIGQLDVSSGGRPLGFWSGNLNAAMIEANAVGAALLETTPGGQIANNWGFLNRKFAWSNQGEQFWGGLSSKYASGASGEVFAWQAPDRAISTEGSLNWKGGYVWKNYEQPIIENLQNMGDVGKINFKLVEPTIPNSPSRWH